MVSRPILYILKIVLVSSEWIVLVQEKNRGHPPSQAAV